MAHQQQKKKPPLTSPHKEDPKPLSDGGKNQPLRKINTTTQGTSNLPDLTKIQLHTSQNSNDTI
jgi:hypothetical protein